jgi:hypothetical protein
VTSVGKRDRASGRARRDNPLLRRRGHGSGIVDACARHDPEHEHDHYG